MTERRNINIHVPVLARVEGEGALDIVVRDGQIQNLQLRIFEPPRLFEKFLEGRDYFEVPDMVARICGICPVAYQMSAVQALEQVFACEPGPWVQAMRRVFYCGEWIQSHSLHIHLLALPDFLGYRSAAEMAGEYAAELRRGLALQALGNDIIALFGARSVHPVGARVGGFHAAPTMAQVQALLPRLHTALGDAEALVRWAASLDLPHDEQDFTSVSLRHARDYPMIAGRLVSDRGLDIAIDEYEQYFEEFQVPHSTALHSLLRGQPYLVGPLARLNLNLDRLPEAVIRLIEELGLGFPSRNMFHSLRARAVEIFYAVHEAIRLLQEYSVPARTCVAVTPRAGVGYGASEAPRGTLWHRYQMSQQGQVQSARIVPPTSQNQSRIEQDLRQALQSFGLHHSDDAIRQHGETVIRNYDPCISCATHFLKLHIDRA